MAVVDYVDSLMVKEWRMPTCCSAVARTAHDSPTEPRPAHLKKHRAGDGLRVRNEEPQDAPARRCTSLLSGWLECRRTAGKPQLARGAAVKAAILSKPWPPEPGTPIGACTSSPAFNSLSADGQRRSVTTPSSRQLVANSAP